MNGANTIFGIYDPDEDVFGATPSLSHPLFLTPRSRSSRPERHRVAEYLAWRRTGAPYVGTGIKAYTQHPSLSAFRHFVDTAQALPAGAKFDVTDCYMSMEFEVSNIRGQPLNFTAGTTNKLIWAIHEVTRDAPPHALARARACEWRS
jgi:hypothetical protein